MNKLLIRGAVFMTATSILIGFSGLSAIAQSNGESGNGFRISPVRSELIIEKGRSSTLTITVENPTSSPIIARPVVNDFVASAQEDGEPRLILDENVPAPKNSFKTLVGKLDDINLGPEEKKDIDVKVTIPTAASAGGYYGAIRFIPTDVNNDGNVSLTASVGTITLVRVPGDLKEQLNLLQFGAGREGKFKSFFTNGDVDVLTRIDNAGDIHLQPFGKVQVKNMFGKVVKDYEFNKNQANILPGSIRKFQDPIGKPSGGLGRYTIEANLGYKQGSGDILTAKASFWYVPVWALVVLGLLLLAIIGGSLFTVNKFKQKAAKKHKN